MPCCLARNQLLHLELLELVHLARIRLLLPTTHVLLHRVARHGVHLAFALQGGGDGHVDDLVSESLLVQLILVDLVNQRGYVLVVHVGHLVRLRRKKEGVSVFAMLELGHLISLEVRRILVMHSACSKYHLVLLINLSVLRMRVDWAPEHHLIIWSRVPRLLAKARP